MKLGTALDKWSEKPPKYTPTLPEYVPLQYRVYHPTKPELMEIACVDPETDQEDETEMFLSKHEKRFLIFFTLFAFVSLLLTAFALMIDKHCIVGDIINPSICLLTDTRDCHTVYSTDTVRKMVEVSVRVDLLLSCIAVCTGSVLIGFKMFNCRLLIGFLIAGICKSFFINMALLMIVTNNGFYFNTIMSIMTGNCGHQFCLEDQSINIVLAFNLLLLSAVTTFFMTLNVFVLGTHILRKYDEAHTQQVWAKWDAMVAELVTY